MLPSSPATWTRSSWCCATAGDPAALAAAASRLLDDPSLRARLSAAATDAVRDYDWPMVARDVVKVYEAVVPSVVGKVTVNL